MSIVELNSTAHDLMSVRAMIEELQAEADALTDKLKGAMIDQGTEGPSGGRLESHMEERQQPAVRQQELQGRPQRLVQPVQQSHHHDPVCAERMRKAACQHADQST